MKSLFTMGLAAISIVNVLALDFPKLEQVSKQERKLGMPFLHDHPSALLGTTQN
jgi:hypothetical protein